MPLPSGRNQLAGASALKPPGVQPQIKKPTNFGSTGGKGPISKK